MADKTGYIGRNPNDSATAIARQFFTASGVTTAFTFESGYQPGFLDVYVDGVKRRVADEFTATDGSTFDVLQGGVGAGSTVEAVAYKAFNAGSVSGDITGNLSVSANSTLEGTLDVTGATTLSSLTVSGTTTLGAGTSVGFANTAFNIGGTPDITIASLSAVDINVSGAATIGGILTYEDVTNIDSVGIVTARTGVEVTANGLVINAGVSTFAADVSIADKIVHTGDTNTAIRFPSVDTFTVETAGVERVRVDSSGDVGLVGIATATGLVVVAGSGVYAGHAGVVTAVTFDGNVTGDVTGSISGGTVAGSTGTFTGDVDIADKIIHTGDTNTAIRFPSADTFTVETGGIQRFEVNSSGDIGVVGVATATGLVVVAGSGDYAGHAGVVTAVTFDGNVTGDVTGAASQVTVADESSDTTCFPLFVTGSTGNLPPKSGSNLTFNSSSGALTASSFVGDLTGAVTGNADTATTSTNVTVADESSDTSCNVLFTTAATGNLPPKSGTNLTFNSSSGALTATSFVGAVTGNVTGDTAGAHTGAVDLNGGVLTLDADADTTITADTDDQIDIAFGGNDRITLSTGLIDLKNDGSQSAVRFYCESSNAHYTALQAAAHSAYSGNATVTLPASSDTLVGRDTTDTLTNKTLSAPSITGDASIADKIIHTGDTNTAIRFPAADTFTVETAGVERLRVSSNVGVGDDNPSVKLNVKGSGDSLAGLNVHSKIEDTTSLAANVGGMLAFEGVYNSSNNPAVYAAIHGGKENATDGNYQGYLRFLTRPDGALPTEKLRIDSVGKILIGPGAIANPKVTTIGAIDTSNSDLAIVMGGSGSGNRANAANKDGRFVGAHYTNAEEPVGLVRSYSTSSANEVHFGGGSSLINTATFLSFYTATNTTTTGGTERLRIDSRGSFLFSNGFMNETVNINTTARTGTQAVNLDDGMVHYFTSSSTGTWKPNFTFSSGNDINDTIATGDTFSPTMIVNKANTAHYADTIQVDGSDVTPEWLGGAPTEGGDNNTFDVYSYTIIKTGDNAFKCFASVSNYT